MNYADIKPIDVANGPGVRVSIFVSGCTHHCEGCFNPETWDFNYGKPFTNVEIEEVLSAVSPSHIRGLSLLGGEPFEYVNQQGLLPLLRKFKEKFPQKDVWCYTGYRFEEDIQNKMMPMWEETRELISYIDILVDGEFEQDKKDLGLRFRGSSNQRIIDVQKSLETNETILWSEPNRI
ncbi:MAG: anaerobic ribonucleoside-triphosphate reductase activating protein [Wujia sp.]